jgi:multiple sugar transport system substrate-binding protein
VTTLKILCWGHRRAVDPFRAIQRAFAEKRPDIVLQIDVRPLSDFEHQGMAGVAQEYDIVVYDHPFSGDIAAGRIFVPLEEALANHLGPDRAKRYVGPSLASYRLDGHVWGVPIDAATQHAAYRADLLDRYEEPVPASWQEAVDLGARLRAHGAWLGIAVETPHALLTIGSLMANAGRPWTTDPLQPLSIDGDAFVDAYERIQQLLSHCAPESMAWNSIDLHDAMVARDDVAYCPCVYGYATYGEADMRKRLSFADFAGAVVPFHAGSAIGGTAAGLSRFSASREEAIALLSFLLSSQVQDHLIPENHGQAAFVSSWVDEGNDRRFNGFASAVRRSMETAWIRPRHPGYIKFQNEAGRIVAQGLREARHARSVHTDIHQQAEGVRTLGASGAPEESLLLGKAR